MSGLNVVDDVRYTLDELLDVLYDGALISGLVVDDDGKVDLDVTEHLSWAIVTAAKASEALAALVDVAERTLDEREQEREEQAGESDEAAYVRLLASGW